MFNFSSKAEEMIIEAFFPDWDVICAICDQLLKLTRLLPYKTKMLARLNFGCFIARYKTVITLAMKLVKTLHLLCNFYINPWYLPSVAASALVWFYFINS